MKKWLGFLIIGFAYTLSGCGKFSDGSSLWQAGLWTLPVLSFIGLVITVYKGIRAYNSGSEIYNPTTYQWTYDKSKKTIPWGHVVLGSFFLLVTIAIIIAVNFEG